MNMELHVWRYVPTDDYYSAEPYYVSESVIDNFISLIWCERYQRPGEFEIVMDATPELLEFFKANKNTILSRPDTDYAMMVEIVRLKTGGKGGDTLRLKGRSLESIFGRRAISQTYTTKGAADDVIYHYIRENIASHWYYTPDAQHPTTEKVRYINLLELDEHQNLGLAETEVQPFGQSLGAFVDGMCAAFGIGYKVRFVDGKLLYSLYRGLDRSKDQYDNDPVIFSADFCNLGSTDFTINDQTYYNRVIVAGEGEGKLRTLATTGYQRKLGGIALKEKYIDKKNVSKNSDGVTNYTRLLSEIAYAEKDASKETIEFYGEALPTGNFQYRRDYLLGDTVTVQNPYGITGSAVVSEVVETVDATGYKTIPNFSEWRVDD